ncbi:MAG: lytic murein transglycosylase [Patescibacteria group bacterium]
MKPKIFIDIKNGGIFQINRRINLNPRRYINIPLKSFLKTAFVFLAVFSFIFGSVTAPTAKFLSQAAETEDAEVKRKSLEAELAEYEKQIDEYEANIANAKKQGKTLKSEIDRLNSKISQLNLQIKAVNSNLKKLDGEIIVTQKKINITEKDVDLNKQALSEALINIYEEEGRGILEVLLANPKLSDFFTDLNSLLTFQENIKTTLKKIIELRESLIDQKEILALERVDAATLKDYKDSQKTGIQKTKEDKNQLLKITKGRESEYQKILVETKKTAAEIRKQIFKLIGGGELNFEEAYELAKFAEKSTGVRAALILAVLDRESALGKNVGRCSYKTAMHPRRDIPIFLIITKELGFDPESMLVSCPISSDGAYGGAMGPAQFIPSTWELYKNKISEITGSNPANPWKNSDAFIGTALYLKDAGAANSSLSQERIAAAKYYAGGRWKRYLWTYGARVINQAQQFEDDIAILSS